MATNYAHGHYAEEVAAAYLMDKGFKVIELNWKTRWCEIDIVAKKDQVVSFVEVKYRLSSEQGGGLDYITPTKLKQMQFAAELWVSSHNWQGEYQLSVIEVAGDNFVVVNFVTDI